MTVARSTVSEIKVTGLRAPEIVMDLERLGSLYPYRLSFMRTLLRRVMGEKWSIVRKKFDFDSDGYGAGVYEIKTPAGLFSFVVFADYLDPEKRSDRVIAEAWDMTATLCEGSVGPDRLAQFRANVPLQEKGRLDSGNIVMTRANKSARNFEYVVDCLATGRQPAWEKIAKVGYLYRTTAVYGSGKFGMADWEKVAKAYPSFASPFAAEMFTCFMIRQFSLEQAHHIAVKRAPAIACEMSSAMKRYIGIGNATGLGMAPYLINHPLLISSWMEVRETALAIVLAAPVDHAATQKFTVLITKAQQHLDEIATDNDDQDRLNRKTRHELDDFLRWFDTIGETIVDWRLVAEHAAQALSVETQELINSLLIEIYPHLVDDLDQQTTALENYPLQADMSVERLIEQIKSHYGWALDVKFDQNEATGVFWYRSVEKMEPRLGHRNREPGEDREMLMGIARAVRSCFDALGDFYKKNNNDPVSAFLLKHPEHRLIVRRIQTMAQTRYGEIRANLLDKDVLPIRLLRCKLSFFGVGKFDPRSRLWVRNTMFQGAPIVDDIGGDFDDDWCFPVKLTSEEMRDG